MKKSILLILTIIGISTMVRATTINVVSGATINGNNAYSWGVSIPVPSGQIVASAQVNFTSITLTSFGINNPGVFYADLLKTSTTSSPTDNDAAGDYWGSSANLLTQLGSKSFPTLNVAQTWSYTLTAIQLASLNALLAGTTLAFSIAADPDCTYTVGGISFVYTLGNKPNAVPEVATTACLMLIGLAGLEIFRRQFASAKMKA